MRLIVLALACLLVTAVNAGDRLPHTVIPVHYALHFAPDLEAGRFKGTVDVDISLQVPARRIVMHAADLDIQHAVLRNDAGEFKASIHPDAAAEQVAFTFDRDIAPGSVTLHITYEGPLRNDQRGWYRGEMFGRDYLATHMEPTDARRMFPAFDEPLYKATYAISVVVPKGMTAISNGALLTDTPVKAGDSHLMKFATVGRMPSYLVALVVGHFECIGDRAGDTPVRVCAAPEQVEQAPFALRIAKESLLWQEEYFGIEYPYGKLDHIAIPDFAIGAMENVGAIIYRSRYLLADEARVPASALRGIAGIIAHETSHQWFGNLVSLKWWDDTWLKEGFASWLEDGTLLDAHPEWRIENNYAATRRGALNADSRASVPAVRRDVKSTRDIRSAFDALSYAKAAAVIRMLEVHAGEEEFREAVRDYFRKNSWGNATMADFLAALDGAGDIYPRALKAYTSRPGVPLIEVESRCEDDTRHVTLRQQRLGVEDETAPWPIPLCLANGDKRQCLAFETRETEVVLPGCDGALFANAGGAGYYVTEHDTDILQQLRAQLYTQMNSIERQTLFNDEWLLVQQGRRDAGDLLRLYAEVRPAEDGELVGVVDEPLEYIARAAVADGDRERFAKYVRDTYADAAMTLGWKPQAGDDESRLEARRRAWSMLGELGNDARAVQEATAMTRAWLDGADVDPTMLPVAIQVAGVHGDSALHVSALSALDGEEDPQRVSRLLSLLSAFANPELVEATLRASLTDAVRPNETLRLIAGASHANAESAALGWRFVQANTDAILAKIPAGHRPSVVLLAAGRCDAGAIKEAENLARRYPPAADETKLAIVRDEVRRCIAFRKRHANDVHDFLAR